MTCQQNQQTQGLCPQYSFSSSTNQITNSGYAYDVSGDLTNDGTHTYKYDAEGRLVSVDNGSTASYVYNAVGERVEKDLSGTYTEYAFDKDGEPEAENNRGSSSNGWVDSWVDFQGQHLAHYENNGVYYIYSNQVGTAGVVTDWTGAVVQDELHYPWGKVWTTMGTQTEERFASLHHRDPDTNLDPTHFRMYSSDEGRWITPDPAEADIYNPQSMSRYAYAGGNPFRFSDPSGACGPGQTWMFGVCRLINYANNVGSEITGGMSSLMSGALGQATAAWNTTVTYYDEGYHTAQAGIGVAAMVVSTSTLDPIGFAGGYASFYEGISGLTGESSESPSATVADIGTDTTDLINSMEAGDVEASAEDLVSLGADLLQIPWLC